MVNANHFSSYCIFVGLAEFMLSSMLSSLAKVFDSITDKISSLISGYDILSATAAPMIIFL